jgi:hypothetical protein
MLQLDCIVTMLQTPYVFMANFLPLRDRLIIKERYEDIRERFRPFFRVE